MEGPVVMSEQASSVLARLDGREIDALYVSFSFSMFFINKHIFKHNHLFFLQCLTLKNQSAVQEVTTRYMSTVN